MKGDTLADKINLPIFKNDKNKKYPHLKLVISPYEMIARTAFSKFTECTRERIQGFEYVQSIFWSKFKIESDKSANRQLVGRPKHSVWLALSRQKQDNVLNLATNTLDADETKKNEARLVRNILRNTQWAEPSYDWRKARQPIRLQHGRLFCQQID